METMANGRRTRRSFSDKYKAEVVELCRTSGKSIVRSGFYHVHADDIGGRGRSEQYFPSFSVGLVVRPRSAIKVQAWGFVGPEALASGDNYIWVANHNGSIIELSASTGALVNVIRGSNYGFDFPLGITSVGNHIWVASSSGNSPSSRPQPVLWRRSSAAQAPGSIFRGLALGRRPPPVCLFTAEPARLDVGTLAELVDSKVGGLG